MGSKRKGQNSGYTKVKCEIKFKGVDAVTDTYRYNKPSKQRRF